MFLAFWCLPATYRHEGFSCYRKKSWQDQNSMIYRGLKCHFTESITQAQRYRLHLVSMDVKWRQNYGKFSTLRKGLFTKRNICHGMYHRSAAGSRKKGRYFSKFLVLRIRPDRQISITLLNTKCIQVQWMEFSFLADFGPYSSSSYLYYT